jgi:hypothetical protein
LADGSNQRRCAKEALQKDGNGTSLVIDVLGVGASFLPGGGLVTGSARAAKVAFGAQNLLAAASFANSAVYKNGPGMVMGIVGGQITATGKLSESVALNVAKAVPGIGAVANVVGLVLDVAQTYSAYSACVDRS